MKTFYLFLFIVFSTNLFAQDYCKQIRKEVNNVTTFNYSSPFDTVGIPPIKITRNFSTDSDLEFDNFVVVLQIVSDMPGFFVKNPNGDGANDDKKLVIEFDDKTKMEEDDVTISYDMKGEEQLVVRSVFLTLEEKNINYFTNKNITKYSFGGVSKTIPPDSSAAYKGYVQCMKNAKKMSTGN